MILFSIDACAVSREKRPSGNLHESRIVIRAITRTHLFTGGFGCSVEFSVARGRAIVLTSRWISRAAVSEIRMSDDRVKHDDDLDDALLRRRLRSRSPRRGFIRSRGLAVTRCATVKLSWPSTDPKRSSVNAVRRRTGPPHFIRGPSRSVRNRILVLLMRSAQVCSL